MPPPAASDLLVFTDLDGTLLDHETYDWRPAQPALDELRRRGIPVIFNSSKTKAEQLALRAEIGNAHPFIVENGAAVYFPRDYFSPRPEGVEADGDLLLIRFGASRKAILDLLAELRAEGHGFRASPVPPHQAEHPLPDGRPAPRRLPGLGRTSGRSHPGARPTRARGRPLHGGLLLHAELHAGARRPADRPFALGTRPTRLRQGRPVIPVREGESDERRRLPHLRHRQDAF